MSIHKAQNPILVIATLGVYFGLILAGATPQVLANAAMTRQFDVKDEIEVKDDLDKKPEPTEKELNEAIEEYAKHIEAFVKNLKRLHSIDKFDEGWETFNTERTTFSPCPETGTLQSTEKALHIDRWLAPAITEAQFISENFTWLADCLPYAGFSNRTLARSVGIKLKYDKTELLHKLSIKFETESRSSSLHKSLSAAFLRFDAEEDEDYELKKILLKHTSLTFSGDQIFIITRLPRAGLVSLISSSSK